MVLLKGVGNHFDDFIKTKDLLGVCKTREIA